MKNIKLISALTAIIIAMSAAGCSRQESTTVPKENNSLYDTDTVKSDDSGSAEAPKGSSSVTVKGTEEAGRELDTAGSIYNATEGAAAEEGVTAEAARETDYAAGEKFKEAEKALPVIDDPIDEPSVQTSIKPEAGLLTAGEWKDNDNWGFFTNLVNAGTIVFPSYGIDPRFRTAVTVTDKDGNPIVNAKARILDESGNILWESITDKKGIAYLFTTDENSGTSVEIENGGKKQNYEIKTSSVPDDQSKKQSSSKEMTVQFDSSSKAYKQNEIMFILDTTGSMGDEMLFLQSEFTAITSEIGTENTKYSVNFYRDKGDEYITKCFDFTSDVKELQTKLNNETATGGGDTPEAVAEILTETINKSSWSEESVKLAFLILDAPPHGEKSTEVAAAVKEASKKGIRLIPVVSSNSERDTELFARAAAIATGGTYIFLTDDSGIGSSHLEPIIGEYKVEKLYDIIIRVINEYKQ